MSDTLFHVLLALAAVIALGRVVGMLFVYLGQPPVIGEVVAGILLGPSLFGQVAPKAAAFLFPEKSAPLLELIAQLGIILYMFLVGLELNGGLLKRLGRAAFVISNASMIVPFLLGLALALVLHPQLAGRDVPYLSFALFLGVALAVTAFPVLARILTDCGLSRTGLGVLALTCAAVGDATAWCLLAFVVGVVQARGTGALALAGLTALYVTGMVLLVRPCARWLAERFDREPLPRDVVAVVFAALLLSAVATEAIGIHALFGAFLLGAVIPHESVMARTFTRTLEVPVTILLLPAFFAVTGLRTQIGLVASAEDWLLCGLITVVATAGKFGGTFGAARMTGLDRRTAAALGVLMNTRGLMELIVLNVGLDLGVISPTLFAILVVMALVTTMATTPALRWLSLREEPEASEEPEATAPPPSPRSAPAHR